MHRLSRDIPKHKTHSVKLMAVVHRLQNLMINENLSPEELVGCAEIVRDNYDRFNDIDNAGVFTPASGPKIPPMPKR